MEFLNKLSKKELIDLIDEIICKIESINEKLACDCKDLIDEYVYDISLDTAKELVEEMKPIGEVYTYETVIEALKKHNNYRDEIEPETSIEYYLVMNMFHNDYRSILEKYGMVNNIQFCYDLSKCFIEDEDGGEYKVPKYFLMMK